MKKILASLLAVYAVSNGQTTAPATTGAAAGTTSAPATTAGSAATTSAGTTAQPLVLPPAPPQLPPGPPQVGPGGGITPPGPGGPFATPAPIIPATPAPVTPAPTFNPYCPMSGALANQHGVQSGNIMSSNQGCLTPYERATAFNGILQCSTFACCQCAEIQCGDPFGLACDELVISDSGAVGNQNINVLGDMTSAFGGNSFAGIGGAMNNGAEIRCNGLEACKASRIYGKYVGQLKCSGDMGCAGANIKLEDPGEQLQVQCNGMMSCMNTNLEIIITAQSQVFELGTIEFNGQQSAQGMTITINNQGFGPVMLQNLECMNPTACPNLRINIIGQVFIENCDLQHMNIQTAGPSLLAACQAGQAFQGNFMPGLPVQPQFPVNPVQPLPPATNPGPFNPAPATPVTPVTPGAPAPATPVAPAPPAGPVTPVTPVAPQQQMPYIPLDPNVLKCQFGQCRNRVITVTPSHNYQVICEPGQCDGMTLNMNPFGYAEINTITFKGATRDVTININGMAEINDIRCELPGSCVRLKVNGGMVMNMDCQDPGSCMQCTVNGQEPGS